MEPGPKNPGEVSLGLAETPGAESPEIKAVDLVLFDDLVAKARPLVQGLRDSVRSYFELGALVDQAQDAGLSLREFAQRIEISPASLSYAQRFYAKYRAFENVPRKLLPTIRTVREDLNVPRQAFHRETEQNGQDTANLDDVVAIVDIEPETVECPVCHGTGRVLK